MRFVLAVCLSFLFFPFVSNAANSTLGGVNIVIGNACPQAGDTVFDDSATHIVVCSGGVWTAYSGGGGGSIDGLSDAFTDYTTDHNMILGGNPTAPVALTTGAQFNTFIGEGAGPIAAGTTSATDANTAIGYQTLKAVTSGGYNTTFGYLAGTAGTTAAGNTIIGASAGITGTTFSSNVFVGTEAGKVSTVSDNTFVGHYSGRANSTGTTNTFIGKSSGTANTTASNNTFIGALSGSANTTGGNNVFLGYQAGNTNTTGQRDLLIGYNVQAPSAATNYYLNIGNVIYGTTGTTDPQADARGDASGAITIDGNLTVTGTCTGCSGAASLPDNLAGAPATKRIMEATSGGTVFMGFRGTDNIYLGLGSGAGLDVAASPGNANTFLGSSAGNGNTSGAENTFIGWRAGTAVTNTGAFNTFVGASAGISATTSQGSVLIGDDAGMLMSTGNFNVAIGDTSAGALTTGGQNTILGRYAGRTFPTTGQRNTLIGYDVQSSAGATNWYVNLANVIYGATGTSDGTADATGDGSATLTIDGSTTFGGTGYIQVPAGTTAQRPGTPLAGMIRYCTSGASCPGGANGFEVYKGAWTDMGAAASSDIRLKTNVLKLDGSGILEKLKKTQTYSFEYKDSLGAKHYGVIAQEFEKLFPELVYSPPNDGMKSVRYLEMTTLLVEGLKQLDSQLEQEKNKTAELSDKLQKLEARIDLLEKNEK